MRLSLSNLAWPETLDGDALAAARNLGAEGVEVAPTRLGSWDELSTATIRRYGATLESAGLCVSSLQAIFFGRPELQLLQSEPAGFSQMAAHMERVGEIAQILEAHVAVFGAPRNRLRGDLPPEIAQERACERLRTLGDIAGKYNMIIGVEPVPAAYGGDFLTLPDEVLELVKQIDHPFVRVHLDTGCALLGGARIADAIGSAAPLLTHFHISEPQLGPFGHPVAEHVQAATALADIGYDRWIAIEMREQPAAIHAIQEAVRFAVTTYLSRDSKAAKAEH
ncbi:MAG TPA: sugar phosphate isomerase/epimerase family protein [Acetobacteraceae bacterium]|jgi:sugar phosphate isomerase/epimerase